MKYFGAVLSSNSIGSEWVERELRIAMDRELKEGKVIVLPLLLEPVQIPPFLRDKVYADFTNPESFQETFPRLLEVLGIATSSKLPLSPPREHRITPSLITAAERSLAQFEDIRIVDIDLSASFNPDPLKSLYNMFLRLSRTPPREWEEIFASERQFPRHTMWRRAWIEGSSIVIYCVPEEIEKYHMDDLQRDVGNSNRRYREYLKERAQKEVQERDRLQAQNQALQDMKKRLGF